MVIILWAVIHFFSSYFKLKSDAQLSIPQLSINSNLSADIYNDIVEHLKNNLPQNDLDITILNLKKIHNNEEKLSCIRETIKHLLDSNRAINPEKWIEEYQTDYLKHLDEIIDIRCNYYAKLVAIKTATSPFSLLDTMATTYNSFRLLQEVSTIYQFSFSRIQLISILSSLIINLYISGESQEYLESLSEGVNETLISGFLGKLTSVLSVKAAEGTINALLILRLGQNTKKLLRPISVE